MICPHCGATVQPYDRFCVRCGHDMGPDVAARQQTEKPASEPGSTEAQTPTGYARPYATPAGQTAPRHGSAWRGQENAGTSGSGSSFPAANPYTSAPNTVSSGTMVNGQPVGARNRGGLVQGLAAIVAVLGIIIAKFGTAIAGLGIVKFLFYWWIFGWLFHTGGGLVVLILIVLLIAGAIWHGQSV